MAKENTIFSKFCSQLIGDRVEWVLTTCKAPSNLATPPVHNLAISCSVTDFCRCFVYNNSDFFFIFLYCVYNIYLLDDEYHTTLYPKFSHNAGLHR